jgi:hypothetical protein
MDITAGRFKRIEPFLPAVLAGTAPRRRARERAAGLTQTYNSIIFEQ